MSSSHEGVRLYCDLFRCGLADLSSKKVLAPGSRYSPQSQSDIFHTSEARFNACGYAAGRTGYSGDPCVQVPISRVSQPAISRNLPEAMAESGQAHGAKPKLRVAAWSRSYRRRIVSCSLQDNSVSQEGFPRLAYHHVRLGSRRPAPLKRAQTWPRNDGSTSNMNPSERIPQQIQTRELAQGLAPVPLSSLAIHRFLLARLETLCGRGGGVRRLPLQAEAPSVRIPPALP